MKVGFGIKRVLKKTHLGVKQASKIRTKKERGESLRNRHKLRRKLPCKIKGRKEKRNGEKSCSICLFTL